MNNRRLGFSGLAVATCALTACLWLPGAAQWGDKAPTPSENPRAHDPSRITACDGKFYFYYTGDKLPMRSSDDMIHWRGGPPVLDKVPDAIHKLVPEGKGEFIWAPDLLRVNGEFWLFYSYSTFGSRISAIGLVSSPTLNSESPAYKWTDRGVVISTNNSVNYNAIDPAPVWDEAGHLWLAFGSWQRDGIQVVQLDSKSGKPIGKPSTIAAGQASGPEAAYIHFHEGYFYLFENEGDCCKGMNSTYRIMMGRSKSITGPYLDKDGKDLGKAGGSLFMESQGAEIGPGHVGIYGEDGVEHVTFHYYDGHANGASMLGMRGLVWGADGWPQAVPNLSGGHYSFSAAAAAPARPLPDCNLIPLNDGYFGLAALTSGKYLTATTDSKIDVRPWGGVENQEWRVEAVNNGLYRIISRANKLAITATDMRADNDALPKLAPWTASSDQKWAILDFSQPKFPTQ